LTGPWRWAGSISVPGSGQNPGHWMAAHNYVPQPRRPEPARKTNRNAVAAFSPALTRSGYAG
jgi:hypothetical protein